MSNPSDETLRVLGQLIYALANDIIPLRWEMQITIGKCGSVGVGLALDKKLGAADKQFVLEAATRIANLDHP